MEKLQLLRSKYIDNNKNVKLTVIKRRPEIDFNSNSTFGRKFVVDVPQQYNGLSQIYVKNTITITGNANPQAFLGTRVFKRMELAGKVTGSIIATVTPEYSLARLDELRTSQLYEQVSQSVESNADFNTLGVQVTGECYSPFPAWFTMLGKKLPTRYIEPLELRLTVNDSLESMGLLTTSVTLDAISFDIFFKYYDDVYYKPISLPMTLKAYNMYSEVSESVSAGATSAKIRLSCPFPLFVTHFLCRSNDWDVYNITRVEIDSANVRFLETDKRTLYNYDQSNNIGISPTGTFPVYWSEDVNRDVNSKESYLAFNQGMYPVVATVYFSSALAANATLYAINEYMQMHEVLENGNITMPLMGSFGASGKQGMY